ncbi:hypothetical protein HDF16_002169 [Granulicella aggregans]|uniref:Uncharacterized protein n=1 Tax=Granulicella aggregans TaxID=474949 RepID=A0A7W7ZCY7_9BACT|nr:hypothetical protein [Granulicella aggregans]MBB5057463.1 hypothetical protein [Granulicella aggregans]
MHTLSRVNVAITGALSEPRSRFAELINASTNGCFVEYLNLQTHYLVCAKHDSQKARKAALYGTAIISEAELREILADGVFLETALPAYAAHRLDNFPGAPHMLTYRDGSGNYSVRTVAVTGRGACSKHEWIGAYDGSRFKTFRADRVVTFERL